MPQLDPAVFSPQLVWLTISFVILYLVMARVVLPRIGDVILVLIPWRRMTQTISDFILRFFDPS